ncbi:unnamed protein product [Prunus armeniaca]
MGNRRHARRGSRSAQTSLRSSDRRDLLTSPTSASELVMPEGTKFGPFPRWGYRTIAHPTEDIKYRRDLITKLRGKVPNHFSASTCLLWTAVPARSTMHRDGDEVWVEDGSRPELQGRLVVVLVAGFRRCSSTLLRERWSGSPGGTIKAEKICVVEPDRGKWVVKSAFGIVKHGGVTPINPGKSRPPP